MFFSDFGDAFGGGIPFGAGGIPGGMRRPRGPVDNDKFYKILGVEKDADTNTIKKAYKKKALKEHPDRGGDAEKFKIISRAHEVLSDPDLRKQYDEYGEEGLEEGGGGGGASDIFGRRSGGGGDRKGKPLTHPLKVSLEDLYNGKTCHLAINRKKICGACEGVGGKAGSVKTCTRCRGQGMVTQIRQMAPGLMTQSTTTCTDCGGEGKSISDKDRCKECIGEKVVSERKLLEVNVEKGMRDKQKITFAGEANESPGMLPGDVHFVIQQREHAIFKRRGNDLLMEKTISLQEALCGYDFTMKHLDGRILHCKARSGEMTTNEEVKVIEDEGMPLIGSAGFSKGRLFILFKVRFPREGDLNADVISKLKDLLPGPRAPLLAGEEEPVTLASVDIKELGANDDYRDEDDEDGPGGARQVQCQNM